MKAFQMKDRPPFPLVRQSDTGSSEYLQMPRWLLSEKNPLSLEATVAYTLLFNRMLLSKQSGWVNDNGEVFLIFTREELANTLKISYRKATAVFRELTVNNLIWEKRSGRGFPNQIYIALTESNDKAVPFKNEQADCSRTADLSVQDTQDLPPSNIENNKHEGIYIEKSLSVPPAVAREAKTDDISVILEKSEVDCFPENVSHVFKSAITRLYHARSYHSDAGNLPQSHVRRLLLNLNSVVLDDV
ncbi:MAG: replication initiator protein A, partial [Oscillospiraceae bacterium]|nr:replication initiator protein A [Oscillospiraceae bacterium]